MRFLYKYTHVYMYTCLHACIYIDCINFILETTEQMQLLHISKRQELQEKQERDTKFWLLLIKTRNMRLPNYAPISILLFRQHTILYSWARWLRTLYSALYKTRRMWKTHYQQSIHCTSSYTDSPEFPTVLIAVGIPDSSTGPIPA